MATHPENTLPAFEEALRLGAQMIEFDVQLTRDGALVLMHDATIDRTTTQQGQVADLTLSDRERRTNSGSPRNSTPFSAMAAAIFGANSVAMSR